MKTYITYNAEQDKLYVITLVDAKLVIIRDQEEGSRLYATADLRKLGPLKYIGKL